MKELYRLSLQKTVSLEEAWQVLEQAGIELAYGEEEAEHVILYLYLTSPQDLPAYSWIETCTKASLPSIDWEAQWAAHGMDFHDGAVHVSFEPFGRSAQPIQLKPGPGFGDLSHPTTYLVLQLMARHLAAQTVIDIGCGSGVLSLAAVAMGAPFAYGIDIDPAAVEHATQNAGFNCMESLCRFSLPHDFSIDQAACPLIVMNMIASEQHAAWEAMASLHSLPGLRLTSGIRQEDKKGYLEQTAAWGWKLKEEAEKEGWMGFCFIQAG